MKYNDNGEYKDIYVKAFDTLPVGTEVDFDGSEVPSGWSEVADPNEYSTTEKKIGTWIDGKPLYRKTFTYTNLSQITSGSYGIISTRLSNVRIIKVEGININDNLGLSRMLPYNDPNVGVQLNILTTTNGQGIRIYYNGTTMTTNDNAIISIYYTKTTD